MMSILICRDFQSQPPITLPPVFFKVVSVVLLLTAPAIAAPAPVFVPIVKPSSVIVLNCQSGRCVTRTAGQTLNRTMRASHRNNDPYGRSHLDEHHTRGLYR